MFGFNFICGSIGQAGRSRNRTANLLDVIDDMLLAFAGTAGTVIALLNRSYVTIRDVELGQLIAH